ncbi:glycosyltransferase family 4 protein [Streptomyces sp. NPDC004752]
MGTTLVITNDFPPRQGGIETFVHAMATRVPDDDVVVYTSSEPGHRQFDATLPFPVIRDRGRTLLPTRSVGRRAVEIMRAHGCDRVWFGAAAPLAAMAPTLRRAGARRIVATTHGHEIWWAHTPGARQVLRRVGSGVDVVTYLGPYTRDRIAPALGPRAHLSRLVPGVNTQVFRPDSDPAAARHLRSRLGVEDRNVVLCVSRLVARKGQDVLIRALPLIQRTVPDAALVLVGKGPQEPRLRTLARRYADGSVVFAGGVSHADTAAHYAAADVFAMPCRTRRAGLEAEGLGIVFLEAQASGLPVIVGDSGGAPDTVLDGETGRVVDGRDVAPVAEAISLTLLSPDRVGMGRAGRRWVEKEWTWDASARHLTALLTPTPEPGSEPSSGPNASGAGQSS